MNEPSNCVVLNVQPSRHILQEPISEEKSVKRKSVLFGTTSPKSLTDYAVSCID